jgi:hypothetical protein
LICQKLVNHVTNELLRELLISYECMHCYSVKIIGEILPKISVFFWRY